MSVYSIIYNYMYINLLCLITLSAYDIYDSPNIGSTEKNLRLKKN